MRNNLHKALFPILLLALAVAGVYAQDADSSGQIAAVMAAAEPKVIQSLESPDSNMRAEVTIYPCVDVEGQSMSYEHLDLIDANTGETERIAEQLINCGGLGAFGLGGLRWSSNGEYFYYTDAREGVPDGMAIGFVPPVWRVAVADSQVERLGQAQFSPNGMWLAQRNPDGMAVIAVEGGEPSSYDLMPEDLQVFELFWLPDSSGFIYIQADTLNGPVTRSTITHVDLTNDSQNVLLDSASD